MDASCIFSYIIWCLICFVLCTKSKGLLKDPHAHFLAWILWPLLLLIFIGSGFVHRNKLRWFKKHWCYISINEFLKFLTNDYSKQPHKKK